MFESAAIVPGEQNTICTLDGLDECELEFQRLLLALVHFYVSISAKPTSSNRPRLNIIVTSRPENSIKTKFNNYQESD